MGTIKIVGDIGKDVDSTEIINLIDETDPDEEIHVIILSNGGDVDQGLDILNALNRHPGIVSFMIERANSISASITQSASKGKRIMAANGEMVIHLPMVEFGMANELDLEKITEFLQIQKKRLISTFKRTGLSAAKIGALLDKETYLDAEAAKELGFIDEIDENTSKAVAIMNWFNKAKKTMAKAPEEEQIHAQEEEEEEETLMSLAQVMEEFDAAGIPEKEIVRALSQMLQDIPKDTKAFHEGIPIPFPPPFEFLNENDDPERKPKAKATGDDPERKPEAKGTEDDPEIKALVIKGLMDEGKLTNAMATWAKEKTIAELWAFGKVAPKVVNLTDKLPDFKGSAVETADEIQVTGTLNVKEFKTS